jgi:putative endonuclease
VADPSGPAHKYAASARAWPGRQDDIHVVVRARAQVTMHNYYVYILGSDTGVLYVGMTNDLLRRVYQHKHKLLPGFAAQHNVHRLLYFEHDQHVEAAIAREKQIKSWVRKKKIALIRSMNPEWKDLSESIGLVPEEVRDEHPGEDQR